MVVVDSSNIAALGYDLESKILTVTFKSGDTYKYEDVPHNVALELTFADSVGSYFSKNVRDKYQTWKAVN